jgi:hypothetical protein
MGIGRAQVRRGGDHGPCLALQARDPSPRRHGNVHLRRSCLEMRTGGCTELPERTATLTGAGGRP